VFTISYIWERDFIIECTMLNFLALKFLTTFHSFNFSRHLSIYRIVIKKVVRDKSLLVYLEPFLFVF